MINLVVGTPAQTPRPCSTSPTDQPGSVRNQSFESDLSEAISEVFSKFGIDPNSVQVTVQNTPGQNSGMSQNSALRPAPSPSPPPPLIASATPQSINDAYWAKQPKAVQQLRNIQDAGQRSLLGTQLAAEGYSIDVPIMVWGWDPGITTNLRQSYGYTWVPSAMQQPTAEAPGINNAGGTPYDRAHPPAGSIAV